MMNLTVCWFVILSSFSLSVYGEANFLQALVAPEYLDTLEKSEALALNAIQYFENSFASFSY